jgi:hypothetical protein
MKQGILTILSLIISLNIFSQSPTTPIARFLSSGNAYATMFFDYYYVLKGNNIYPGKSVYSMNVPGDNAFSFRRVYFGYDHNLSETFSGRVQLELTDQSPLPNGSQAFFLKDASLRWKNIYPLADLYIGHTSTPVFSTDGSESIWRYRSIERTISDHRGLRSSSDTGIRLSGLFTENGKYGYNFMIGNGAGTKPESDKYKVVYMNLWTKLFDQRLYLELFQDYNKAPDNRYLSTSKGFVAWKTGSYAVGTEVVNQKKGGFGFNSENIDILGISVFAHADIKKEKLRVFARYDSYNPDYRFSIDHYDTDGALTFDEQFFSFGIDIMPHRNVSIMPNMYINSYSKKNSGQNTPETEVVARITMNVSLK